MKEKGSINGVNIKLPMVPVNNTFIKQMKFGSSISTINASEPESRIFAQCVIFLHPQNDEMH